MTREEAKKILGEGANDEQITALLNAFHSKSAELEKANNEVSKYKSELEVAQKQNETYKVELDNINNANLTKEEQLAKREEAIAKREAETSLINNKAKVKERLSGLNLDGEALDALVDTITTSDGEKSLASADVYMNTFNSMKERTIQSTKEELINVNAKPVASNNPNKDVMTWDKFRNLSQEEKTKFQKEHPQEFANL